MACCLPTCARGFPFSGTEVVEKGSFLFVFLASPWYLVHPWGASFACHLPCVYKVWQRYASYWTRPEGGGRWGHYLCYPWGVCWAAQKTASQICCVFFGFCHLKLYMHASFSGTAQSP